ncbi:MAG: hypothetical protein AB1782_14745 [Cyanobacteriota bacterium]
MSKIVLALVIYFLLTFNILVCAQDSNEIRDFELKIPNIITVNKVGLSTLNQKHGLPISSDADFNLLVRNSFDGTSWELTTNKPIGVSISYNSSGTILAVFASMQRLSDGYKIPDNYISIHPSKVVFDTGPSGGDVERIFHFNPIVKVSKHTPPGHYVCIIKFTVSGE